jgi:hypothetical protein
LAIEDCDEKSLGLLMAAQADEQQEKEWVKS